MKTALLVGTIKPHSKNLKSTVYSDENYFVPEYRLKQYLGGIYYYLTQSNFDNIIFCENSNYKIDCLEDIERTAKLFNKKFELIQFNADIEKIEKYSYHYGEAELLDYAFDNSILLKESTDFYKITGRYIIYNINELIEFCETSENYFYKGFGLNSTLGVNTAFFKCSNEFYSKNIYGKQTDFYKKSNKLNFIPLEKVYYLILKKILFKNHQKLKIIPIYQFFKTKDILIEHIKLKSGFIEYKNIGKLLDIVITPFKN
ncbi:MAG: hypothetical protein V3575_00675 [Candidatus Absconditabacteria bacterium]